MRRSDKKAEDKVHNYKALISQYYQRDPLLQDVREEVAPVAPDIQILDQLTKFEHKIDALIKQKRYDVQELYMKPPLKLKRLLRVKAVREKHSSHQTIKVFGHMHPQKEENINIKMTSFFRQLSVLNDKDKTLLQSWKKPTSNFNERDGLVVKIQSNIEDPVTVQLTLISNPPKYEVDPALEKIVGVKNGTRLEVLDAFWLYIKTKKLQDIQNKEIINSDDLLRQAFKTQKLTFATINNRVRQLLVPAEGVKISLGPGESKVVDVIVEIQEKPSVDIVPFFAQKLNEEKNDHPFLALSGKIKKYDTKFKEHSQKLRRHLLKRNLYRDFRVERIEEILAEQEQLLAMLDQPDPLEDYGKLKYILQNDQELQRQVKHYFQQLTANTQSNN